MEEKTVGERLAELRDGAMLTQEQVGKRLGVDRKTISSYEKNTRQVPSDMVIKMARLYHVSADYILGLEKKKAIPADGLTDEQFEAISFISEQLSSKNAK